MSHLLIVLKAFNEVEHPAWREYDEAYCEKMTSTGEKIWCGMDVALYQELCASRQKLRTPQRRKCPREPQKSALCLGVVTFAGSTMIVFVRIRHASSHMYVRFVGGTTLSDSALGGEKQTFPRAVLVSATSERMGALPDYGSKI